jgi:hypothetical protein
MDSVKGCHQTCATGEHPTAKRQDKKRRNERAHGPFFGEEVQEFAGAQELQNGTVTIFGSRKIVSPQIEYSGTGR